MGPAGRSATSQWLHVWTHAEKDKRENKEHERCSLDIDAMTWHVDARGALRKLLGRTIRLRTTCIAAIGYIVVRCLY